MQVGRPGDGLHDKYTIIIGSGYMDDAGKEPFKGAAFVYTSDNPTSGWKYEGELCQGDGTTGAVWECPLLARVSHHPDYTGSDPPDLHMLVVCPDNPHNTPVYFLGRYDPKTFRFDMKTASGPHPVDLGGGPLGSTFYAPNVLNNDPHGRLVMWGWCQETGRPGDPDIYDYASCLSVPRLIWRHPHKPGLIWQEPLPCLSQLRRDAWHLNGGDTPTWTHITHDGSGKEHANGNGHASNGGTANGQGAGTSHGAVASSNAKSNGNGAAANFNGNGPHANGNGSQMMSNGNSKGTAAEADVQPNSRVSLKPGQPLGLPRNLGSHPHVELEITLEPPASLPPGVPAKTGMIIRSNEIVPMTAHEASGRNGAALLYDWRHARLEVVFSDGMEDIETLCSAPAATYDMMNATSRVYLNSEAAQAGEAAQHSGEGASMAASHGNAALMVDKLDAIPGAMGEHCHVKQGDGAMAQGSFEPLLGPTGPSGRSGSSTGDHTAEHRALDVRGCHSVGGQLTLWPSMNLDSSNGNGVGGNGTTDNEAALSKAAVGGVLQPIRLRVFMDHSMLEAFTSTGQVLTTRVYHQEDQDHNSDEEDGSSNGAQSEGSPKRRGSPASDGSFTNGCPDLPPSLELASFGVESSVSNVTGYLLAPIWQADDVTDEMEARAKDNYGAFTGQAANEVNKQVKVNA